MKALTTVAQTVEQLKDREDQRRTYQHRAAHSTGAHKEQVERNLKMVEREIRKLKAMRLSS